MAWHQPPPPFRRDGYVNMLNRYGTAQDNSTAYGYAADPAIPDQVLTAQYETNGLFATIIDAPAEEAIKHGFGIGLECSDAERLIFDELERLNWEEEASWAVKCARLYGGALGVMLIDDGGDLDEPLNWRRIRGIDELRVYDRSVVWPDHESLISGGGLSPAPARFGMPERYFVQSARGQFWVHESRCLVFRNGRLPERTLNPFYRFWGMPEYARIHRELRETATTHGNGVKLLERSVQAIYKIEGLARLLATEDGETEVVKRLQTIDLSRGLLGSIAIDSAGEDYDFKTASMAGVKEIIDSTCNLLSAVSKIPQTILFGRSPAGMNASGRSELESYYSYVERLQKLMLKKNLCTLLAVIARAALNNGELEEEPKMRVEFAPLWSMSETEKAAAERDRAQTAQIKAQTTQMYVNMDALAPGEVRRGLAREGLYQVEELLGEDDLDEDIWGGGDEDGEEPDETAHDQGEGVGVIVAKEIGGEKHVLVGVRSDNGQYGGPGGRVEPGEAPEQAAVRETMEEFGIIPDRLLKLGKLDGLPAEHGAPTIYYCDSFTGKPGPSDGEMEACGWWKPDGCPRRSLYPPFAESLKLLERKGLLTESGQGGRMDEEDEQWVTVGGTPVKVEKGQSVDSAVKCFLAEREAEKAAEDAGLQQPIDVGVRPAVSSPKLKNFIDHIYKGQLEEIVIGNGTTMDAVRYEKKTGRKVGRTFHTNKANQMINGLNNRLESGRLNKYDTAVATALICDLQKALAGK